ncbi:MAG: DMT family transporter [Deltaproteobacteria bacterium]|nr:MAG: DMT family transporter [Deltaproteobacteria bacterium]
MRSGAPHAGGAALRRRGRPGSIHARSRRARPARAAGSRGAPVEREAALARIALVFLLGVFGIACAPIFVRLALPAPPVVIAFYRLLFAAVLFGSWLVVTRRRVALPAETLRLAAGAGACFGTDMALWHAALTHTSVANATLLVNTTPIHVGLVALWLYGERLDARFVLGAALALGGTAVLLGAELGSAGAIRGDLLALAAAAFYSGYLLLSKAARRRAEATPVFLVSMLAATAVLGLYAALGGDRFSGFPLSSWLAMLGAAIVSQLLGVLSLVWSFRYLRTTFTSVALLLQPLGATLLAWLLLGEAIVGTQAVGGCLVLAGILLASARAADPRR